MRPKHYVPVDFKFDIGFIRDKAEEIISNDELPDNKAKGVQMCWTAGDHKFDIINEFADKVAKVLDCKVARSCYSMQLRADSHLPVHMDLDDEAMEEFLQGQVYSLVIPIKGSGITEFWDMHPEDEGPEVTGYKQRHDVLYDPFDPTVKDRLNMIDTTVLTQPTILSISYPHSVTMTEAPRITYFVKLVQCKHDIDTIARILSEWENYNE